ncbi:hypothetical protein [Pseudonocardia xishanensis]|uniref:Small CPxCG-related zinc finger protein n=1 Tax=Pseudonocardia xishanensis TaxID=630995 RepID=A0ABP8S2K1_9PSEU
MPQHCDRCRREAPTQDSTAFLDWEAIGDGSDVRCPDCVTGAEQQAVDDDMMDLQQAADDAEFRRITGHGGALG